MAQKEDRPVRDDGLLPREVPYRAGVKRRANLPTRKNDLLDAGPGTGYVPGHNGTRQGSTLGAGYVDEARWPDSGGPIHPDVVKRAERRPMPREVPIYSEQTHTGTRTRYLDGHSEIHRERHVLIAMMNHPETDPDEREHIRKEIAHRDGIHLHKYW